jgi:hypothetical protein
MKKIFVLFFSIALLTACSNDDNPKPEDDPVLGKWFIVEINNGGSFQLTDCSRQSFIVFLNNGSTEPEFYSKPAEACIVNTDAGVWSNLGDSRYRFEIPFGDFGPINGRVEFTNETNLTFFPDLLVAQNTSIVFEKR